MLDSMLLESTTQKSFWNSENIKDNVMLFVIAGSDTTTSALTWLIYLLGRHPDKQDKLIEEIDEFLLDLSDKHEQMTLFNVKRLKYLASCINESLRLYPNAPWIGRYARTDIQLDNGTVLPCGMDYYVLIRDMHRNERYFRHAHQFIPERFMMSEQEQTDHSNQSPWLTKSAFIPFSTGPRNCIGKEYSLITQKLFIINLLSKYRVKLLTDQIIEPEHSVILKPIHYPIEFQLRNNN